MIRSWFLSLFSFLFALFLFSPIVESASADYGDYVAMDTAEFDFTDEILDFIDGECGGDSACTSCYKDCYRAHPDGGLGDAINRGVCFRKCHSSDATPDESAPGSDSYQW